MAEYIVHKAVNLDAVKAKRRAVLSQPGYLEREYLAQAKYDGCNMVVVVSSGSIYALSRTGESVKSCDHILAAMQGLPELADGAYLGEAWCPDASFAEISGWFRRQTGDEETCRLQFAVFDFIPLPYWVAKDCPLTYVERTDLLPEIMHSIPKHRAPVWLVQGFGRIVENWPGETAQTFCNKLVAVGGYDGLIMRDPNGAWKVGRGTDGEIVKIKRVLSFDLRVVGFEPGKGKHAGKIGSLIVEYKGQRMGAGTGLKDAERDVSRFESDWLGKIVEIEAMDYSEDGLLREPRLKGVRHDKLEPDA